MNEAYALANLPAYDRWAESYPPLAHNALMQAEQAAMLELLPSPRGLIALDLACGTGRYVRLLRQRGAAWVVGSDLSSGMLDHAGGFARLRADMMKLPFRAASFELVTAGLAVGHAPDLGAWLAGLARVMKPGAILVYSDFHPEAAQAGMTRTFVDSDQVLHVLKHRIHELHQHQAAADSVGFEMEALVEVRPGEGHGRVFDAWPQVAARWPGVALVLAIRLRKRGLS
ncbi:class I SAM-dependent methyltransferase [Pelomonas sp. SE-A7]|uniref:class I SAM-dependent methyltransferase n=1 Tax=Pelomonas sp. SE-A7 TaxID=3054953 RepID=UPI00259C8771|nr:class I SAM-dependent methyltransferase [Pelomonas sp. SE-A7]MDM4765391.1 methyltransferase domain-containing protein [Pelomonas sp. SE-A7]